MTEEQLNQLLERLDESDKAIDEWKIGLEKHLNKRLDDYFEQEAEKNAINRKALIVHSAQVEKFLSMIHDVLEKKL